MRMNFIAISAVAGLVIIAAGCVGIVSWFSDTKAAAAFAGVVVGAAASTATTIVLAHQSRRFQLATAVLEKRLAAHQEGYAQWRGILNAVHHPDKIGGVVAVAQAWWNSNCLYLDSPSRSAFYSCLLSAIFHKDLLSGPRDAESKKMIEENWATIMKPGTTLVEGVQLPTLPIDKKRPMS